MPLRPSTILAWSPLLCWLVFTMLYELFPLDWRCTLMNPGGSEMMCGGDYAHPLIQFTTLAVRLICLGLIIFTAFMAIRKKLTALGWIGFLTAVVCTSFVIYLFWVHRNDCLP